MSDTLPNKLTVEDAERLAEEFSSETTKAHYRQFADALRENAELKKYPLKMICEKCNVITDVTQHKHSVASGNFEDHFEQDKIPKKEWPKDWVNPADIAQPKTSGVGPGKDD